MLKLISARCCNCDLDDSVPVAIGEDFEYRTSPDTFLAVRCRRCGVTFLNPRPTEDEIERIYSPDYHAFNFSRESFGIVYHIRRRLEAGRMRSWCESLPPAARILDVGCGNGFHLDILREHGSPGWMLEGVDADPRAVKSAAHSGVIVHLGRLEDVELPASSYDLVLLIMTLEHVPDPLAALTRIRTLLRPGGRLVIVTDNTDSLDCRLYERRYWGGYHFPRHFYLFNRRSLRALAERAEFDVAKLSTLTTPVNWVYSLHNMLSDWQAPAWLVKRFCLTSAVSLSLFTIWDRLLQLSGRGGILLGILRRPLR